MAVEMLNPAIVDENSDDLGYSSNVRLAGRKSGEISLKSEVKDVENGKKKSKRSYCGRFRLKGEQLIVTLTIVGVIIGIILGFCIRIAEPTDTTITLVMFPGELLMRMLKMLIIPIIVTSIVTGLANLDMKKSGRMGAHAIIYYLTTTMSAVILGIILVIAIHPGDPNQRQGRVTTEQSKDVSTLDTYLDLVRNVFPDNIIAACFEVTQTKRTLKTVEDEIPTNLSLSLFNLSSENNSVADNITDEPVVEYDRKLVMVHNTNVLGVIAFFIAFGITLSSLGEEGRPVTNVFNVFNRIFMRMITIVIWYSPFGICSLIAGNILKLEKLDEIGQTLGMYMLTVIAGLLIHGLIVLPIIFWVVTRQNPYRYALGISQALLTALGTASSAGTLPITMRCLENNLGVDKRVTQFVLPLGATMNMDGTALLEGVAAITIAQMYNMTLSFGQIVTISLTATLASIGAAAIPSAGLVTLLLVLTAIGIPTEAVGIIWSIDWFLDRIRTALNVFGDCIGAGIVQHLNRDRLNEIGNVENSRDESLQIQEEKNSLLQ